MPCKVDGKLEAVPGDFDKHNFTRKNKGLMLAGSVKLNHQV